MDAREEMIKSACISVHWQIATDQTARVPPVSVISCTVATKVIK